MENARRVDAERDFNLRAKNRRLTIYATVLLLALCVSVCYLLWLHGEVHRLTMKDLMRDELARNGGVSAVPAGVVDVATAPASSAGLRASHVVDEGDELDEAFEELVRLLQMDAEMGWRAIFVLRSDYFLLLRPPPYEPAWWAGWIGMGCLALPVHALSRFEAVLPPLLHAHAFGLGSPYQFVLAWVLLIMGFVVVRAACAPMGRTHRATNLALSYLANPALWFRGVVFRVALLVYLVAEQHVVLLVSNADLVEPATLVSMRSALVLLFFVACLVFSTRSFWYARLAFHCMCDCGTLTCVCTQGPFVDTLRGCAGGGCASVS